MSDSPAEAGKNLEDPREESSTENESTRYDDLHVTADTKPGKYFVANKAKGTAYRVNLVALRTGEGKPCECPDSHYRQDPEASDVCKHVIAAIEAGDSSIDMALAHELAAVRNLVDNLLQNGRELNSAVQGLQNEQSGGYDRSNDGNRHTDEPSGPSPQEAAKTLQDAFDNAVNGMEVEDYNGKVWINNTPDAPDWVFDAFMRVDETTYAPDEDSPGQYFKNYLEPSQVDDYISEVVE